MAEKQHPPVEPTDEKPAIISHIDDKSEIGTEKHASAAADYTGAERKSDPEEIALVKKIDWRLMVRPLTLYLAFPAQKTGGESILIPSAKTANTNGHVLPQLRRSQRNRAGTTE